MACYVNKLQLAKIEKWTFPYYYIYVQNVFCFNVVDLSSFYKINFVADLDDGAKFCQGQETGNACRLSAPYLRFNTPCNGTNELTTSYKEPFTFLLGQSRGLSGCNRIVSLSNPGSAITRNVFESGYQL